MPSTLSETSTWGSSVTIPSAGDLRNVSSVNTSIGTLANRTQRLKDSIPGRVASYSWRQPGSMWIQPSPSTQWTNPSVSNPHWLQSNVTSGGTLWMPVVLPTSISGTLTTVEVFVRGGFSSTHSSLPASLPVATLRIANMGGASTTVATQTDTSASVGVYDAMHPITISSVGFPVMPMSPALTLTLSGESGANSVANALAVDYVVFTLTGSP